MNKVFLGVLAILLVVTVACVRLAPSGGGKDTRVPPPANQQPVAYIDAIPPAMVTAGTPLTFTGHGTDTDGSIIGYEWRSSLDGVLSTVASFTTSSLSPGTHTISFKVLDNSNSWSVVVSSAVTVKPKVAKPVINSFTSAPPGIIRGSASLLSWNVSGAQTVFIDNGVGPVSPVDTKTVYPAATTVYTLTATNEAGSVTAVASVEVTITPATGNPVINFTAQHLGGSSWQLQWNVTNANRMVIEPIVGTVGRNGSIIVTVPGKTTFRLTAYNDWGSSWWDVTVVSP